MEKSWLLEAQCVTADLACGRPSLSSPGALERAQGKTPLLATLCPHTTQPQLGCRPHTRTPNTAPKPRPSPLIVVTNNPPPSINTRPPTHHRLRENGRRRSPRGARGGPRAYPRCRARSCPRRRPPGSLQLAPGRAAGRREARRGAGPQADGALRVGRRGALGGPHPAPRGG